MLKVVIGCGEQNRALLWDKLTLWLTALQPNFELCLHAADTGSLLSGVIEIGNFSGYLFLFGQGLDESGLTLTDLSVKLREFIVNSYMIYICDNLTLLPMLTNAGVMPSGFLHTRAPERELLQVIANACSQYTRTANRHVRLLSATVSGALHNIPFDNIYYIEAADKLVHAVTTANRVSFRDTLAHLEKRLQIDFLRCHQSFLVNESKIRVVDLNADLITLENGAKVPVSRSYLQQIRQYVKLTTLTRRRLIY